MLLRRHRIEQCLRAPTITTVKPPIPGPKRLRRHLAATMVLAGLATLAAAGPAEAGSILFGTDNGEIGTLNTSTDSVSNQYNVGGFTKNWYDIAENNAGAIYTVGVSYFPFNLHTALYSIDPVSHTGTKIGQTGVNLEGLAFGGNGTLYGSSGSGFYTVSTSTGAATKVGGGVGGTFQSAGDIAYAGGGTFYATSSNSCGAYGSCLWKINATTGTGVQIGGTGYSAVWGLAMVGGSLYGLTANNDLLSLDTATGNATLLKYYATGINGHFYGAAVAPDEAVPSVPEPGSLSLLFSALVGLGVVTRLTRRRGRSGA